VTRVLLFSDFADYGRTTWPPLYAEPRAGFIDLAEYPRAAIRAIDTSAIPELCGELYRSLYRIGHFHKRLGN
jgi:hypothetical protein